ncbi:MAG: DUF3098 domain-containing protein [Paludibacteraceae bacterium]
MDDKKMMFPPKNMIWVAGGVVLIVTGFLLMTGSKSGVEFNPDIYGFRRTVIAPVISLTGFFSIVFALLYKRKSSKEQ